VLEAAFWAFLGSCSLLLGVELALRLDPGERVIGLVMAFGAGAMISAVSYELVLEASEASEFPRLVGGMALGSLAFIGGSTLLDRFGRRWHKGSRGEHEAGSPLAIVLGAALDGVPESVIIGISVISGGVSASFITATFLSNLPESMSATSGLTKAGWQAGRIRLLWLGVCVASVVSAALGYLTFELVPQSSGALLEGFAAGALLTMLADTMMPEAFELGGRAAGTLTVVGFAVAFALSGR
jgi:ZIP family zinc transporter